MKACKYKMMQLWTLSLVRRSATGHLNLRFVSADSETISIGVYADDVVSALTVLLISCITSLLTRCQRRAAISVWISVAGQQFPDKN